MQQFTVPQFIDVEDKIIGPITTRQFIIMLGAAMLIAVNYKIFDFSLFLFSSVIIFALTIVFAFVKINGRPFHFFVLNMVQTFKRSNLRIWSTDMAAEGVIPEKEEAAPKAEALPVARAVGHQTSRLEELSLIVDTQGAFKGEMK